MAKPTKPAKPSTPSSTDALMQEALKKQEIAKAIAISRAADFTGKPDVAQTARSARAAAKASSGVNTKTSTGGAERRPALAGHEALGKGVRVAILPPLERLSLRARPEAVGGLSKALGLTLPTKPKTSATVAGRTALWLGPDEWLVLDDAGGDPLEDCSKAKVLHSAVGISHRNVAIAVTGHGAEATLSAGCPQNLSLAVFPVGACSRTILGKAEVIVLRTGEEAFHVECWRSFSDYVFAFLADAARDAAA